LTVQGPGGTRELVYDALLLGTGRKANVEHLDLETAGVRFGTGGVEVDDYLRTSNPNIDGAGDVAFPQKFTHAAIATARLCVANALDGADRRARELVVPHCTYTDPEVAQVGLTPRQAREDGVPIDEYRLELGKIETRVYRWGGGGVCGDLYPSRQRANRRSDTRCGACRRNDQRAHTRNGPQSAAKGTGRDGPLLPDTGRDLPTGRSAVCAPPSRKDPAQGRRLTGPIFRRPQ
jgi:hypothetical protein